MKTLRNLFFIHFFLCLILFSACGGNEGSGTQSNTSGNTGSVALFLADGPADVYEAIYIWIKEVSLLPNEAKGGDPVIIYESQDPNGYKLNILDYVDNDFLFTVKHDIPAGFYKKIRLNVLKIESEGGECDLELIKVTGNKIDLNPREGFYVKEDAILAIRLDIDAEKSINLHPAGDKCIFRPVVFVDIETIEWQPRCPKVLKGEIIDIIEEDNSGEIEDIVLDLPESRGTLDVFLLNDPLNTTVIFDNEGNPGGILEPGQTVWIRGKLDSQGDFHASEIVIGEIAALKGTVDSEVYDDGQGQQFSLRLAENQLVFDPNITVQLTDETLVLAGCENEVAVGAINPGLPVKIFGKLSIDKQVLRAIVLFLSPVSGELASMEYSEYSSGQDIIQGRDLTIIDDENREITIFLPESASICLVGDGIVPLSLLCAGIQVQAVINPYLSEELKILAASELKISPENLSGIVGDIDNDTKALIVDGNNIHVQNGATIMDLRGQVVSLFDFGDVRENDRISCFGLDACPSDTSGNDFYAFVILIVKE
ncbi:MAG: DUF4382 domain-containing protein [bacterium]